MKVVVGEGVPVKASRENFDTLDFGAKFDAKIVENEKQSDRAALIARVCTPRFDAIGHMSLVGLLWSGIQLLAANSSLALVPSALNHISIFWSTTPHTLWSPSHWRITLP